MLERKHTHTQNEAKRLPMFEGCWRDSQQQAGKGSLPDWGGCTVASTGAGASSTEKRRAERVPVNLPPTL